MANKTKKEELVEKCATLSNASAAGRQMPIIAGNTYKLVDIAPQNAIEGNKWDAFVAETGEVISTTALTRNGAIEDKDGNKLVFDRDKNVGARCAELIEKYGDADGAITVKCTKQVVRENYGRVDRYSFFQLA